MKTYKQFNIKINKEVFPHDDAILYSFTIYRADGTVFEESETDDYDSPEDAMQDAEAVIDSFYES